MSSEVVSPACRARAMDSAARGAHFRQSEQIRQMEMRHPVQQRRSELDRLGKDLDARVPAAAGTAGFPRHSPDKRWPWWALPSGRRSSGPHSRIGEWRAPVRQTRRGRPYPSSRTRTPSIPSVYEVLAPLPPRLCSIVSTQVVVPQLNCFDRTDQDIEHDTAATKNSTRRPF